MKKFIFDDEDFPDIENYKYNNRKESNTSDGVSDLVKSVSEKFEDDGNYSINSPVKKPSGGGNKSKRGKKKKLTDVNIDVFQNIADKQKDFEAPDEEKDVVTKSISNVKVKGKKSKK